MDYKLSCKEKEVLGLLSIGFSNSEISEKLGIVIDTTKAHISSIFDKLKVENRIQAAIKAIKEKIV